MTVAYEEELADLDDEMRDIEGIEEDDDEEFDLVGPLMWHGCLAPEGIMSGDGRMFSAGALTWRDLPLPLRVQEADTGAHNGAIVIATIDRIVRRGERVMGEGQFIESPDADRIIGMVAERAYRGVSIDADSAELAEGAEEGAVEFAKGRICAATIVAIPAFAEAYIALGPLPDEGGEAPSGDEVFRDVSTEERDRLKRDGHAMPDGSYPIANCEDLRNAVQAIGRAKDPAAVKRHIRKRAASLECEGFELPEGWADDTEDFARGPGWVTNPRETRRIHAYWTKPGHKGYAKVRWGTPGDFTRLRRFLSKYIQPEFLNRTAAQWHHDALGYWPGELGMPGNAPATKENRRRAARHAHASEVTTPETYTCVECGHATTHHPGRGTVLAQGGQDGDVLAVDGGEDKRRIWAHEQGETWGGNAAGASTVLRVASWSDSRGLGSGSLVSSAPLCESCASRSGHSSGQHSEVTLASADSRAQRDMRTGSRNGDALKRDQKMLRVSEDTSGQVQSPAINLVAAATLTPVPSWYFDDPKLDGPTGLIVDGDHVYGHLATWGVCHVGIKNVCTTAPHSGTGYAHFRTGAVLTDKGRVSVGQITMGTGHADLRDNPRAAADHYSNTGLVVCDVAAGEDDHGIWISGCLREGVTPQQAHALQAGAISGDWRNIGGSLELIAALVVNVPGFPVPRPALAASGETQLSLVAAGVVEEHTIESITDAVVAELARRDAVAAKLRASKQVINAERVRALTAALEH